MAMADTLSESRLTGMHPLVAQRVRAADAAMGQHGEHFRIACGLRTGSQQAADYAAGRTAAGPIRTNARPFYSWHQFGLAVDCYPFLQGSSGDLDWSASDPLFERMVEAMKAQGFVWGGEWHSIQDPPHFQPAEIPVSPTDEDRAAFKTGGLAAVWARYPELGRATVDLQGAAAGDWHTANTIAQVAGWILPLCRRRFWREMRECWRRAYRHARNAHAALTGKPKP